MKNKRKNNAVSEIIGTVILLGIAISLFSLVQVIALSFPFNANPPSARIVGNIDGNTIYIFHHGGESLSLNTKIIFTIDGDSYLKNASEILNINTSDGDNLWNIGEKLNYTHTGNLVDLSVDIMVIDHKSNSVIMMNTLQG
jgi:flagellin-like protein